jgi:hypothetical protein
MDEAARIGKDIMEMLRFLSKNNDLFTIPF